MTLNRIDLVVLLVYVAGTVLVGLWVGRKSGNTEEFMAAGRKLPGWAVGLSIFGTYVSSISFLALPSKAYDTNWNAFVFSLSIPLTAWIAVRYFVPFYRKAGAVSSYEHLEYRFGPWARTYAVVCYVLTQLARMGMIMYLVALVLAPLTGLDVRTLIWITGAIVIVYTVFGGMEAVIWTEVIQSTVFIVGSLACVAVLLFGMPQGPGQFWHLSVGNHKFSLGSFGTSLTESTFWVILLYGVFTNLQNFGIDQSYVQRYQTARTDKEANRSVWLGSLLYLPISGVFLFIGTGLFAFYSARPELLPAKVAATPDAVFPHFIVAQLPAGLTGLVIAAIAAAAQSTVSSSINCSATLLLCDVYRRYLRPLATERESMRVLWSMSLVVGLAGTGMALAMMHIRSALDTWWQLASIFSGGMLGLFLLGLISRRAKNPAAITGVVIGVLVILWMSLSPLFLSPLYSADDIKDLPQLADELQNPSTPASTFVVDQFDSFSRQQLAEFDGSETAKEYLRKTLVIQFNKLITSAPLVDQEVFQQSAGYEQVQQRLAGTAEADKPRWQNRLLLDAIFPKALAGKPDWAIDLAPFRSPFNSVLTIVIGTLTIFFVGLLVSRFGKPVPDYLDSESVLTD